MAKENPRYELNFSWGYTQLTIKGKRDLLICGGIVATVVGLKIFGGPLVALLIKFAQ